ncbi:Myxococcus cysteine-rich repeat-containing protein [Nannocystis exedens]|uniref:Myxococcus cysteine-rich repeat-containing protein n=1 Tax=Nannocystis exedens TaxID=54 RepID=A0A1I2EX32_9BACT|nr:PQQ-binding-like beta-propeller repeat protein [Nannocystis exedens]PCC69492.1 cellulose-binding [Nannocystis exedens]SFE97339.1 Myxococcus cysteine-rich repeat-containing protein [Nannocystis exedens]
MPPFTARPQVPASHVACIARLGEVEPASSPSTPARRSASAGPRRLTALSLGPWLLLACPSEQTTTTDSGIDPEPSTTTTTSGASEPDVTTTTSADTPTTAEPTTAAPTSTSTGPAPAVCGDGVVAGSESCDDGNDELDDGCDKNCERTAAVLWTYTHSGAAGEYDGVAAVAVDPTGKIVLAGREGVSATDSDMLLIALDPDGTELWKRTYPDPNGLPNVFYAVVLGDDGTIYAAGTEEQAKDMAAPVVRSFDADGNEGWTFIEPPASMIGASISGLVLADGKLYSAGAEDLTADETQLVLRRHDLATGEADWTAVTQAEHARALGFGVVKIAGGVVVAGLVYAEDNSTRPLLVTVDDAGTIVGTEVEEHPGGTWFDAEAIGAGGDIALVGRRQPEGVTGYDFAVRRVGPDLAEQWTDIHDHEFLYGTGNGVAVGPDEQILAVGFHVAPTQFNDVFGALYAGDGARLWTHTYNNEDIDLYDEASDAAWGPGFWVVAGQSVVLGEAANVWVRAFKAE